MRSIDLSSLTIGVRSVTMLTRLDLLNVTCNDIGDMIYFAHKGVDMAQTMVFNKLKFLDGEILFKKYVEMGKGGSIEKLSQFAFERWHNPRTGRKPTRVGVWSSMWRWALHNPDVARKIYDGYVLEFGENLTDEIWYSLLEARAQKLLTNHGYRVYLQQHPEVAKYADPK